jgi:hypothetical protein
MRESAGKKLLDRLAIVSNTYSIGLLSTANISYSDT